MPDFSFCPSNCAFVGGPVNDLGRKNASGGGCTFSSGDLLFFLDLTTWFLVFFVDLAKNGRIIKGFQKEGSEGGWKGKKEKFLP
ncbi:MAG: hypothetical protein IPN74_10260 [Haliscomenobacter sp.]|nr:hypothetical protein [Haliscomenobacter sp.]MBK8878907.1 hypothetical protein [Haliscomenobacter sp.]